MHWEKLEQQQQVAQQLGLSIEGAAAADAAAANTSNTPMFFSEPGAAAAARASAAGAAAGVSSKSDPGAAAWGFGSLAYRRTAAKTIYDRASIAAATAAAAATQAGGVLTPTGGSSSSAAAKSVSPQSWEGQDTPMTPSAQRLSCMAMSADGLAGGRLSCSSSIRSSSSLCDSGTGGPRTPSSSSGGCKTPSKLGQTGPGDPDTVGQVWLGRGPVTAADEDQEAAAAQAEQQYYAQLHATAAEQAKMHGELRDTFVLKAYKGRWVRCW
jgi:hypothetical protein